MNRVKRFNYSKFKALIFYLFMVAAFVIAAPASHAQGLPSLCGEEGCTPIAGNCLDYAAYPIPHVDSSSKNATYCYFSNISDADIKLYFEVTALGFDTDIRSEPENAPDIPDPALQFVDVLEAKHMRQYVIGFPRFGIPGAPKLPEDPVSVIRFRKFSEDYTFINLHLNENTIFSGKFYASREKQAGDHPWFNLPISESIQMVCYEYHVTEKGVITKARLPVNNNRTECDNFFFIQK